MKRKFTLIEILGVTILISVLAAIGIASYTYAMESAKESATRATIARIASAFEALREKGLLPKIAKYSKITIDLDADKDCDKVKFYEPNDDDDDEGISLPRNEAYKIFMRAIDGESVGDGTINDAWGKEILVKYPGVFNRGGVDIISAGSDGVYGEAGKDEPIASVNDSNNKYRDSDGDWICDDIANF